MPSSISSSDQRLPAAKYALQWLVMAVVCGLLTLGVCAFYRAGDIQPQAGKLVSLDPVTHQVAPGSAVDPDASLAVTSDEALVELKSCL